MARSNWPSNVLQALLVLSLLAFAVAAIRSHAEGIPDQAKRFQRDLVRSSHTYWGLDAPVALFAAQIHQESRWDPMALSPVGAQGLAQFMPATSDWFASMHPRDLGEREPFNPGWAMRALVIYDAWLFERIHATRPCDKWAMVLSAYNGGLGWLIKDKRLASAKGADSLAWFNHTERFNSGRSVAAFRENRRYPVMILLRWEPMYVHAGWGDRGVMCRQY